MKKYRIGYTQGTFDTLHYGHVRLLRQAKELCDYLIVGVNSDSLVREYKNTETIVKEKERAEIVEAIKYVDKSVIVNTLDKMVQLGKFHFNAIFIGDDWKGNQRWAQTEEQLREKNVPVVYLSHTPSISTTIVKSKILNKK